MSTAIKIVIVIVLLYIGVGILASFIGEEHRRRIRIGLIALGAGCLFISFVTDALSVYVGAGLIFTGLVFVPLKKQLDILLDVISFGG